MMRLTAFWIHARLPLPTAASSGTGEDGAGARTSAPADHGRAHSSGAKRSQDSKTARRDFLKSCGKFAAYTPPAVVLLLSATERNYASAASGGFVSPFQSNVKQGINSAPGLTGTGR